ncbi:MAG: hypothetical protein AAGG75_14855 [Bacteroidota bacterium]
MKKVLFSLLPLLLLTLGTLTAQDAGKALKNAKKAMNKYAVASDGHDAILADASQHIDDAIAGDLETKDRIKALQLSGEINSEIANKEVIMKTTDPKYKLKYPEAATKAYNAYKELLSIAQKKFQKKDAIDGLLAASTHLTNMAKLNYGDQNYAGAYEAFNAVTTVRDLLKANGNNDLLDSDEAYHEHLFMTGLSAISASKTAEAKPVFMKLYDAGYERAAVYEALYKIKTQDGDDDAVTILEAGRAKFPTDEGLRIAEINYYLKENKLDDLVGKLTGAIEQDPENISLYSTLGHVYDNLYQREEEAGNVESAASYFDKALKYYNEALGRKPDFFDAIYNIGALYYNKAALLTKELVSLEGDYSKSGIAKYDAKKAEVFAMFDKALPFFQRAEGMNANDVGTLTALKEIYAKKDDLEKYNAFKSRLETVQGGGQNEASFFNK